MVLVRRLLGCPGEKAAMQEAVDEHEWVTSGEYDRPAEARQAFEWQLYGAAASQSPSHPGAEIRVG